MSWSISVIGVPEKVNAKLDEYSATLNGASKEEFDAAKPHLQALIAENVGSSVVVELSASGHASFADGQSVPGGEPVYRRKVQGTCLVSLKVSYTQIAV